MGERTDPPFRFSVVRLILFVNLVGIGAIPLAQASWGNITLLCFGTVACFFIALIALKLDNDEHGDPTMEDRYSSIESALWLGLGAFLLGATILYINT